MTPYRWRIWAVLLWIGSLFVPRVIAAIDIPGTKIIAFFLLIAGFGSVIFGTLKYWRCPECGGMLRWDRFFTLSDCPHCGYKFEK